MAGASRWNRAVLAGVLVWATGAWACGEELTRDSPAGGGSGGVESGLDGGNDDARVGGGDPSRDADGGSDVDRTVPSGASVQSTKRGVAAGGNDYPAGMKLTAADLDALAPGLSWFYNWSPSTEILDAAGRLEFLPMAWGRPSDPAAVAAWLAAHPSTRVVLAANEPNLAEQANLSAADTAKFLEATRLVAGGRPVVGPHLAASGQTTTFRNAVSASLAGGLSESCIHIYDRSTAGFDYWASRWPHEGWPVGAAAPERVWVKEVNIGDDSASEPEIIDFMIHVVDTLESDPRVVRYAWWKDRRRFDGASFRRPPEHFLLSNTTNGKLTALGDIYVTMPVRDPRLWYAVPGRLEAERYLTRGGGPIALQRTADAKASAADPNGDGRVDVVLGANGWLDYQIDVPTPGSYPMTVRATATAAGKLEVLSGTTSLGTIDVPAGGYATTKASTINLPAGRQTVRVRVTAGSVRLNWLRLGS